MISIEIPLLNKGANGMKPETAKTIAIMIKVLIFFTGSALLGLLKEFKIGALWICIIMLPILWALLYKWENLWLKSKAEVIKDFKFWFGSREY